MDSTGPFVYQQSLFPRAPVPRFPPLHLRLWYRSSLDGLLEFCDLHRDLLGHCSVTHQRPPERENPGSEAEPGGFQSQTESGRKEVDGDGE